jgi:hypothetical protein
MAITIDRICLGPSEEVLIPGSRMKKKGWALPPGMMYLHLVTGEKVNNYSERSLKLKELVN